MKPSNKAIKIKAIKESKKPSNKKSSIEKREYIVIFMKGANNSRGQMEHLHLDLSPIKTWPSDQLLE